MTRRDGLNGGRKACDATGGLMRGEFVIWHDFLDGLLVRGRREGAQHQHASGEGDEARQKDEEKNANHQGS